MSRALGIKGSLYTLVGMLTVTYDQTPLTDEQAINAILDVLDVPYFSRKSQEPPPGSPEPPDWSLRLHHNYLFQKWHEKRDVWVAANEKTGYLHRVVIDGLLDEKEATFLRSEFARRGAKLADVEEIAKYVTETRERRRYQDTFQGALIDVRNHFKWRDGVAIESEGRYLPLSSFNFSTDDVELLRAVFERLPLTTFDPGEPFADHLQVNRERCPTCGSTEKTKRAPMKVRGDALKRLAQFNDRYSADVFAAWVSARLKPGPFTVANELYADYRNWAIKQGDNKTERSVSKDTVLSIRKWGSLMIAWPFPRTRHGVGKGYRVALRRA